MKTEKKIKEENAPLKQLRDIRDKLSSEIKDMSVNQISTYLNNKETLHPKNIWNK